MKQIIVGVLRVSIVLSTCFVGLSRVLADVPVPFFLQYKLDLPIQIGDGINANMTLTLVNTSQNIAKDITVSPSPTSKTRFGQGNLWKAGTLQPGEQVILQTQLFDPKSISKTGSLLFEVKYTNMTGSQQIMLIKAVGATGGAL